MNAIQSGQIWQCNETGENWLVTRTYSELFTSYAILRKVGVADQTDRDVQRVKVERSQEGMTLRGFSLLEEG